MFGREDEAAVQTDAYIEALLARHARRPVVVTASQLEPPAATRRAAELLHAALPRFHPSFRFEQELAARLRASTRGSARAAVELELADVIVLPLPGAAPLRSGVDEQLPAGVIAERRLLIGGAAIASGVSLAGAAMFAWRRRERTRSRRRRID